MRQLEGWPPEILTIPLTGHTRDHACIAVEGAGAPLVHRGDAYFHRAAVAGGEIPLGLRWFEKNFAFDGSRSSHNHARLRELREGGDDIRVVCAHDADELDPSLSARNPPE